MTLNQQTGWAEERDADQELLERGTCRFRLVVLHRSRPRSASTLLGFLFLVAPGVSYEIRRERRRPAPQNSAFREAARIALWSLVFTTPTVVALALLSSIFPTHLPDVLAWSAQGKDYAKRFSSQIATFLLAEVVVAQVFAIVTAAVGRQDRGAIRQGDIWHKVFAANRP